MMLTFPQVEGFDKSTTAAYKLLALSETPEGLLLNLVKVLKALEKDKVYKNPYNQLKMKMLMEDAELQKQKQILIDWMINKIKQFPSLPFYKFSEIKNTVELAGLFLSGERYKIGDFLGILIGYFEEACQAAAFYGNASIFEGWLGCVLREHEISFSEEILKTIEYEKLILPSSIEGKQLIEYLGHGFVKAIIKSRLFDFNEARIPQYYVEWGHVTAIAYPKALQIWQQSQKLYHFHVQSDYKAEDNLKFLFFLSQIENYNPIPTEALPKPKSVFEAEALCNQQILQDYLSKFKTHDWNRVPASREYIMSKVDRLLTFLQAEENVNPINMRGHRNDKKAAREFVNKVINNEWDKLEWAGKKPGKHQDLRSVVHNALTGASGRIRNAISNTLITLEIRKFAKLKKWVPSRGKDQGKRHVC